MAKFSGKMYNIHSSKFVQIGWEFDKENNCGVVRVTFKNGRQYDYWPITKEKYSEVFTVESKGKWLTDELINNKAISYEEVTIEED